MLELAIANDDLGSVTILWLLTASGRQAPMASEPAMLQYLKLILATMTWSLCKCGCYLRTSTSILWNWRRELLSCRIRH